MLGLTGLTVITKSSDISFHLSVMLISIPDIALAGLGNLSTALLCPLFLARSSSMQSLVLWQGSRLWQELTALPILGLHLAQAEIYLIPYCLTLFALFGTGDVLARQNNKGVLPCGC